MENKTCLTKNICNFCIHFLTLVLITSRLYSFGTYSIIYSPVCVFVCVKQSSLKTTARIWFWSVRNNKARRPKATVIRFQISGLPVVSQTVKCLAAPGKSIHKPFPATFVNFSAIYRSLRRHKWFMHSYLTSQIHSSARLITANIRCLLHSSMMKTNGHSRNV